MAAHFASFLVLKKRRNLFISYYINFILTLLVYTGIIYFSMIITVQASFEIITHFFLYVNSSTRIRQTASTGNNSWWRSNSVFWLQSGCISEPDHNLDQRRRDLTWWCPISGGNCQQRWILVENKRCHEKRRSSVPMSGGECRRFVLEYDLFSSQRY